MKVKRYLILSAGFGAEMSQRRKKQRKNEKGNVIQPENKKGW
jgi:hypothetical protein